MKRLLIIVGICLSINLFALDIEINDTLSEMFRLENNNLTITSTGKIISGTTGIHAGGGLTGWINIYGELNANYTGIGAQYLSGDITIFSTGTVEGDMHAIDAGYMIGSIINNGGDIYGTDASYSGISSNGMIGNISNLSGGTIRGTWAGIDAEKMVGNIYNDVDSTIGSSESYDSYSEYGIYAHFMIGNITNWGTIISETNTAIFAEEMKGNIINNWRIETESGFAAIFALSMEGNITNNGDIIGGDNYGIYARIMTGDITNLGTITSKTGVGTYKMGGDLYNYGDITGTFGNGIKADLMSGHIYNDGTISGNINGIYAYKMTGNIYNGTDSDINGWGGGGSGIFADEMEGSITNYGWIYGEFIGINALQMIGNIYNEWDIDSKSYGINAQSMKGNIINNKEIYGNINGIYASSMEGDITNNGIISGDKIAINAQFMYGDIINNGAGSIEGINRAIYANNMYGNLINHGYIFSIEDEAIFASLMIGNIINYDDIISNDSNAIYARGMEGDIINHNDAHIDSNYSTAIRLENFSGTLYNYGYIYSQNIAIQSLGNLNLVGNGQITGSIAGDEDTINITNDMDTVLDLTNAPLIGWSNINLLGGEMIISEVDPVYNTTITQSGTDTYVHIDTDARGIYYVLNEGTLNPWHESSPFGTPYFDYFSASSGSTIVIDFGAGEVKNDHISSQDQRTVGTIEDGVTLKFTPHIIYSQGWWDIYSIFSNIEVSDNVIYEIPLLYSVVEFREEEEEVGIGTFEIQFVLPPTWLEYNVLISRNLETYSDYATYYNQEVAKLLDLEIRDRSEEIYLLKLELKLALEQATSTEEFNAVLEPYNMVGYASLANNNINWINNRTSNLFNLLSGSIGSETGVSNSTIGSSYATANADLSRDVNGNNVWFNVYMSDNTLDGKAGYELESDGFEVAFGIDKEINDNLILGVSLNLSDFESDVTGGLPVNVESEGLGINTYAQYTNGRLRHKAVIGFTEYDNEASRAGAEADFDSNEFYAAYRVECLIKNKNCFTVPFAGLQYSHITYDDIIEKGGNSGLEGYDYDSLQSELGVKLVKQFNATRLVVSGSWLHELMDTETDATATSGIGNYSQDGIERDEDTFRLAIGLNYKISDRINLSIDYAKELGSNTDSDSINAKVSFSF